MHMCIVTFDSQAPRKAHPLHPGHDLEVTEVTKVKGSSLNTVGADVYIIIMLVCVIFENVICYLRHNDSPAVQLMLIYFDNKR